MRHLAPAQTGAVLPIALFILTIVTLVGVATLDTSNVGLRMMQNSQGKLMAEMAIDRAIAQTLEDTSLFVSPAAQTLTVTSTEPGIGNFIVQVSEPRCLFSTQLTGYSQLATNVPELTYWEFTAQTIDPITRARVVKEQGVRIRLPAFVCA